MKTIRAIAVLMMLVLAAVTAEAEMTEYERGVQAGLKVGFFMGELYGKGQYTVDAARQFNDFLDEFQEFLARSFGDNQTLINEFNRTAMPTEMAAQIPGGEMLPLYREPRIMGYPADAYYTAVGAVPETVPENPQNAMGWV